MLYLIIGHSDIVSVSCPDTIREVVSPETGLVDVDITINSVTHRIKLPVGNYQYERIGGEYPCQLNVHIKGTINLSLLPTLQEENFDWNLNFMVFTINADIYFSTSYYLCCRLPSDKETAV